jgi:ABC-type lipoprotein export system ATPase subunit
LVVTHDKTVAESCPRTIQLRDGRVFADTRRPNIEQEVRR